MSNIEENTVTLVADEVDEVIDTPQNTDDTDEYVPQFDEVECEQIEPVVVKPKKKFPLMTPVIIALCIVLATAIGYGALWCFVPTIEGTWIVESEEAVKTYFAFEKTDEGYMMEQSVGTISAQVPCYIEKGEGETPDTLVMSMGMQNVNCTYTVTGNRLFGERTLVLTDETGVEIKLKSANKPELEDYLKPYENFKANEKLVGEWVVDDGMGNVASLTLDEDGVMILDLYGSQKQVAYYTTEVEMLKRKLYYDKEVEDEYAFEITDKGLVYMNQLWTKVDPASADQK